MMCAALLPQLHPPAPGVLGRSLYWGSIAPRHHPGEAAKRQWAPPGVAAHAMRRAPGRTRDATCRPEAAISLALEQLRYTHCESYALLETLLSHPHSRLRVPSSFNGTAETLTYPRHIGIQRLLMSIGSAPVVSVLE